MGKKEEERKRGWKEIEKRKEKARQIIQCEDSQTHISPSMAVKYRFLLSCRCFYALLSLFVQMLPCQNLT